ncbi:hypothetical protein GEMRC1_007338 [Eukaryota sp. GEM-RC1]
MTYTDSSVGVPLHEHSYATDCRIYTPGHPEGNFANVVATVKDEFVFAHVFGWWAKMIMFRDFWIANTLSILFEFVEYTFQHVLENFKECWFDHWILDVALCNLLGIWLGSITCEYLSFPKLNWFSQVDGKRRTNLDFCQTWDLSLSLSTNGSCLKVQRGSVSCLLYCS